ncbi:MAG: sodium-dependent transporter [Cyclobacteriaceae bacterium]|nr:sodium-dependent transporter [Cyclobacteriaceae bacterium]
MSANKEAWGTRIGLILAMAGNAVGFGNFLRFPVQAVQNGGGAFIIPYIVCFLVMGIPLLWIEWAMGRFGGRNGHHSTPFILDHMMKTPFWKYFGVFGVFTNIAVAAYYCYLESWTLSYVFHSIIQTFDGMSQGEVAGFFSDYVNISRTTTGIPYEAVIFYILCLLLNTYILSKGLKGGVEKVAKFGVPMLLVFGFFLALRGVTLGASGAPEGCNDCNAFLGLNFLWEPRFSSLTDPKVWLAAAGQIFFTLSVGIGTIHCYASYVRENDDIALNAMSAGWMNGFVEIVLGASIVIPIAVGYLGLDWVKENAGFAMAFQTMPYLFGQWGPFLATISGVFWFGLLFFAGITSSLAMGTPWMGFMEDEFDWPRKRAAWSFGGIVLIMGLPTVLFFGKGVFDEYDYWAGTVSLVVFALAESIIFSWRGITKGWNELNRGADIKIPDIFRPITKYVTPFLLFIIFLASLATPMNNDWKYAFENSYELDPNSIIGKIQNKGIIANRSYFANHFESEVNGEIVEIGQTRRRGHLVHIGAEKTYFKDEAGRIKPLRNAADVPAGVQPFDSLTVFKTYSFKPQDQLLVDIGDYIAVKDTIARGKFINNIFYVDMAKLMLSLLFLFICFLVYKASQRRKINAL